MRCGSECGWQTRSVAWRQNLPAHVGEQCTPVGAKAAAEARPSPPLAYALQLRVQAHSAPLKLLSASVNMLATPPAGPDPPHAIAATGVRYQTM